MSLKVDLFVLLFARFSGFFLISPLFAYGFVPLIVRLGISFSLALLLSPPLSQILNVSFTFSLAFWLMLIKELAIGYLLGFIFSFLFEAALFAGQVVGTLAGFSATEVLDPLSSSSFPLISRLFFLTLWILFFALDLHHPLIRLLYDSFFALPLTSDYANILAGVLEGSSKLFHYALSYAIYPFTLLTMLLLVLALFSKDLPIFLNGLPLQILVGLGAISLGFSFFGPILLQNFWEWMALAKRFFFSPF